MQADHAYWSDYGYASSPELNLLRELELRTPAGNSGGPILGLFA